MQDQTAARQTRSKVARQTAAPPVEAVPSLADDLECDLDELPVDAVRDICERLREESRRRTVALASAVHELRTPLAVMEGYMELLFSGKAGSLNEKQQHILEDMKANEKRLKTFIADFLTFAAIETKNLNMNFEVGNLNDCLSEVCTLWMPRFQQKG